MPSMINGPGGGAGCRYCLLQSLVLCAGCRSRRRWGGAPLWERCCDGDPAVTAELAMRIIVIFVEAAVDDAVRQVGGLRCKHGANEGGGREDRHRLTAFHRNVTDVIDLRCGILYDGYVRGGPACILLACRTTET